jgi:signal transduction histidine kinase
MTRSRRDWLVDSTIFVHCLVLGAVFWALDADRARASDEVLALDALAGLVLCLGLWWRRRWPVALALVSVPVAAFSAAGSAAVMVALFTVAIHRRWPVAVGVLALQLAVSPLYLSLHPEDETPEWVMFLLIALVSSAILAWGMFVRARRQLVESLRDRVARAESEQQLRVEQARQHERTRIAREMHDVLAHRISLVSLHAGALEFRPDAPQEEVARAAGVIRAAAHQALDDLREVIGVLREGDGLGTPERPQPTLAQLPALLDESRAAGMRVDADLAVAALDQVPTSIGRSALRIVQEGLTNARKHAPAAKVTVRVAGAPGNGLTVEVANPVAVHAGAVTVAEIPGAGTGLVGLAERATLAGGRLEHGLTDEGHFRLRAWLPWAT